MEILRGAGIEKGRVETQRFQLSKKVCLELAPESGYGLMASDHLWNPVLSICVAMTKS